MKQSIYIAIMALCCISCETGGGMNPNDNKENYFVSYFEKNVQMPLIYFYNAYYMAMYEHASAEEKVSPKFDLLRTGIIDNGSYHFKGNWYNRYGSLFKESEAWTVGGVTLKCMGEDKWQVSTSCMSTIVRLEEENESVFRISAQFAGTDSGEIVFAEICSMEDFVMEVRQTKYASCDEVDFSGTVRSSVYKEDKMIDCYEVTYSPGLTPTFKDIY